MKIDPIFSRKVSHDALTLLIRETGQALLDSRLSVSSHRVSSLDESTGSQMVRAINKLAVQASTSSARHISLGALMSLQQQLLLQETETPNEAAFNRRISRIVTKLFGKVIKAEQGEVDPFSSATVDMEALICAIENMLVAVYDDPQASKSQHDDTRLTCESMATVLLQAMTSARGSSDIRELIAESSLDSSSHLSSLIDSVAPLSNMSSLPSFSLSPSSPSPSKQAVSKDVASLVSAVATARVGVERDHAAVNLRRHREQHGDEDLNTHLSKVSSTFRSFVLQHLNEAPSNGADAVVEGNISNTGMAVSDRLRTLRSKLHATENTTTEDLVEGSLTLSSPVLAIPRTRTSSIPLVIPSSPQQTSTTQIPVPKLSTPSKSNSVSSLRQRLAAAQQSRAKNDEGQTKSTFGHAAALRARLEAVKKQNL